MVQRPIYKLYISTLAKWVYINDFRSKGGGGKKIGGNADVVNGRPLRINRIKYNIK